MKKSDLVRIYNEKFGIEDTVGGIEQKRFTERLNKVRKILEAIFNDKIVKSNMKEFEMIFFNDVIKPIINSSEEFSEEAKNLILPLIRYYNHKIMKNLYIEFCSDKYLLNTSDIDDKMIEEFLYSLKESYIKLDSLIDQDELERYKRDIRDGFETTSEIKNIYYYRIFQENEFCMECTGETTSFKENFKEEINYNYKIILMMYYIMATCIREKRMKLLDSYTNCIFYKSKIVIGEERARLLDKIFMLVTNELKYAIDNSNSYNFEKIKQLKEELESDMDAYGKYIINYKK